MALHQAKLLLLACLLSSVLVQISMFDCGGGGGIAIYWGQNSNEGSLAEACNTGLYDYVNIASLIQFGGGRDLGLNLAGHCDPARNTCTKIGREIKTCQSLGVKVLLSIGGGAATYSLSSAEDAKHVAHQIWNSYLGGTDSSATRLFGHDAILDGVDFHIGGRSNLYYDDLAIYLKELYDQQGTKTYYLAAAPQCFYPDYYLDAAIKTGLFDFVWVQFYNNPPCQYNANAGVDLFLDSWNNDWTPTNAKKLFLGLPASPDAAPSGGYIIPEILNNEVLPIIKKTPKYGGVMLWNRYFDRLTNYSSNIIDHVKSENRLFSIMSKYA
nr:acidic endochitinase-like [Ziziphus jujuba var. spinosa]